MALVWNRNGLRKPVYRKEYYYDDLAVIVSSDDCLCSFIARQSVCDVVIYLHLYPSAIVYSRRYSSICAYDLLHSFHRHFSNRVGVDTSLTPIYHTKFNHQRNSVYNTGKKRDGIRVHLSLKSAAIVAGCTWVLTVNDEVVLFPHMNFVF